MSFSKRAPSRALLSHLRKSPFSPPSPCLRSIAYRQLRCESTENRPVGEGRSFKGQLYESTSARLAREQAERNRFSRERQEGSGGRNMALTFGGLCTIFLACFCCQLLIIIVCSDHRNGSWRLLLRNICHTCSIHRVYDSSLRDNTSKA